MRSQLANSFSQRQVCTLFRASFSLVVKGGRIGLCKMVWSKHRRPASQSPAAHCKSFCVLIPTKETAPCNIPEFLYALYLKVEPLQRCSYLGKRTRDTLGKQKHLDTLNTLGTEPTSALPSSKPRSLKPVAASSTVRLSEIFVWLK